MYNLLAVNNKLSLKLVKPRMLDFIVGVLIFGFAEFLTLYYHLNLISAILIFISIYIVQDTYKRGFNTIDIVNLVFLPISNQQRINQYIILGLFEYKTVLLLIHLLIVLATANIEIGLLIFLAYITFSIYLALHNYLVKRYKMAYQVLVRLGSAFSVLIFLALFNLMIGSSENSTITRNFFFEIEGFINNRIILFISIMIVKLLLIYTLVFYFIKKLIKKQPFTNKKNMLKANKMFY